VVTATIIGALCVLLVDVRTYETSVYSCETRRRYVPEVSRLQNVTESVIDILQRSKPAVIDTALSCIFIMFTYSYNYLFIYFSRAL
jgi:hypothetical protein